MYNKDNTSHEEHLRIVFNILHQHQLHINAHKCTFECHDIKFLGHSITKEGVKVDKGKVIGHYHQFMINYNIILRLLNHLLKATSFQWNTIVITTFQ